MTSHDDVNPFRPPEQPTVGLGATGAYRSLSMLTLSVSIIFTLEALSIAAANATAYRLATTAPELWTDQTTSPGSASGLFDLYAMAILLNFVLLIGGIVVFLMWIHRANQNADALVPGHLEYTPGWAVGWFFVPILNLWKPYKAMEEIYLASDPEAEPDFWSSMSPPGYLLLWWVTWIGYNLTSRITDASDPNVVAVAVVVNGIAGVTAALLLILITRKVHAMQEQKLVTRRTEAFGTPPARESSFP